MSRVFNFGAGPAALPLEVVEQIREDLPEYRDSGMSVMEMSHRGAGFKAIAETAEARLRALLGVPDDYHVLFLQGGASTQFAAVPLNLAAAGAVVDYVDTGAWSRKAIAEARRFTEVNIAASSRDSGCDRIPGAWSPDPRAAYLHYTPNETIGGVEFHQPPTVGEVALVADMSSTILSRPIDVERFALIYAGAQKNIGIAGLTVVIVRRELCGRARAETPRMLDYQVHAAAGSLDNTAPTFAWYVAGLVFEWIEGCGGLAAMAARNQAQAARLYRAIDASSMYANPVQPDSRSWMNVPFTLADPSLDGDFLHAASAAGLVGLKGHRSVGGMRASLYNAMSDDGVVALIELMAEFERTH